MAILFNDTTKNPPQVTEADQGETVLYFPDGLQTIINVREDEVTLDTKKAHPDVVVFGLDEEPTTIKKLIARGVHEFTIEPKPGATVLKYSFGRVSGEFAVMRSEVRG